MSFEKSISDFTSAIDRLANVIEKALDNEKEPISRLIHPNKKQNDISEVLSHTSGQDQLELLDIPEEEEKPVKKGRPRKSTTKTIPRKPAAKTTAKPTAPKKKRKRRTKAQIEADRQAAETAAVMLDKEDKPDHQEKIVDALEQAVDKAQEKTSGKSLFEESLELAEQLDTEDDSETVVNSLHFPDKSEDDLTEEVEKLEEEQKIPLMDVELPVPQRSRPKPGEQITKQHVRDLIQDLLDAHLSNEARILLARYGVKRAADLKQDQLDEAFHELSTLLPEEA